MSPTLLKSITELPRTVQSPVAEFAAKLLEKAGDNVQSLLVYGSAAGCALGETGGNYNHGVSNINIAVIVKELDFGLLRQSLDLVKWGRKHRISAPLFLTKEYILNALDVFPIEFGGIKERHKVIFGEDIFKDLDIPRKDVALLCEQQVKGKLLRLRQAYLETGTNPFALKKLLSGAFTDLVPVFMQLIRLKGQEPHGQKEEMLKQLAGTYSLDPGPFLAVYHDKNKKALISYRQVEAHLQNFLDQLESLSRHLDTL
ncbi:MAG: hypothetical protein KGJ09_08645 [Candidatus Omnitrophica bacterium]|nr:hypothetical protein [Candidatus Omnitrophota bacterium]MDE2214317.1 hypothetical protein [Candidatus Omnitrophota bacterium]